MYKMVWQWPYNPSNWSRTSTTPQKNRELAGEKVQLPDELQVHWETVSQTDVMSNDRERYCSPYIQAHTHPPHIQAHTLKHKYNGVTLDGENTKGNSNSYRPREVQQVFLQIVRSNIFLGNALNNIRREK